MNHVHVQSASLASVGYDPQHGVLEVEFRNGRQYRYFAVPRRLFEALMSSSSKGAFLNTHIKSGFPFELVDERKSRDSTQ